MNPDPDFRWGIDTSRAETAQIRMEIDRLPIRIVAGRKGPHDLRLEWLTPDGWVAPSFRAAFVLCDFFYENEDWLYPRSAGYEGGQFFARHAGIACRDGWQAAWARVERQKQRKREKRENAA